MKNFPAWNDHEELDGYIPTPEQIAAECRRIRASRKAQERSEHEAQADEWDDDWE